MRKKGISLIVLVITIIVMIILAAAVVISMSNTGIIDKVYYATQISNDKQVQTLAAAVWADVYAENFRGTELKSEVVNRLTNQGVNVNDYGINITDKGIEVTPNTEKVTTLATTLWQFNDHVSGYEFFGEFDYENQTGWEDFTDGTKINTTLGSFELSGLSLTIIDEYIVLSSVQPSDSEYFFDYVPQNNLGIERGWYGIDGETTNKFLNNELESFDELKNALIPIPAPSLTFSAETNPSLMNVELRDWLYQNARRIK